MEAKGLLLDENEELERQYEIFKKIRTQEDVKAIYKARAAFANVAEEMGVYNEDDVQTLVDEVRYGKEE